MVAVFIVGLIPYMIYMKWLMRCPACDKRGTLENKRKAVLRTTLDGREEEVTWLYFVCRHCGIVLKDMCGTWDNIGEEAWEMASSNEVFRIQSLDELRVKPKKQSKRKPFRKNRA